MNPKKYWRIRPAEVSPVANTDATLLEQPKELLAKLRPREGLVIAGFDENEQIGTVSWLGIVREVASDRSGATVDWKPSDVLLRPNPAGRRYWRQGTPFFSFAPAVVERYMLNDLFAEAFPEFADLDFGSTPRSPTVSMPSGTPTGGYVYVIKSEHGFKIGKTVNLRDRTRLFAVKLPFPITVEHYAWFDDYTFAERRFHEMFSHKRLEGEWFDLDGDDLARIREFGETIEIEGL